MSNMKQHNIFFLNSNPKPLSLVVFFQILMNVKVRPVEMETVTIQQVHTTVSVTLDLKHLIEIWIFVLVICSL